MAQDINLLTTEKKHERKMATFSLISLVVLIFTILTTVVLLLYLLFLKTNISSVTGKQTLVLKQLQLLNVKKVEVLTTRERLATIQNIKSSEPVFAERLNHIAESSPGDISISTISTDLSSITVSMNTANLASFNTFFNDGLTKIEKGKGSGVKTITLQSFNISPGGSGYDASMQFIYATPFK